MSKTIVQQKAVIALDLGGTRIKLSLEPLTFVVIGEIFPNRVRGQAMSICIFLLWVSVFLVSQFFPILLESIGSAFTFWAFMLLSVAAFVFVKSAVPETKGKTLEEIDQLWIADRKRRKMRHEITPHHPDAICSDAG